MTSNSRPGGPPSRPVGPAAVVLGTGGQAPALLAALRRRGVALRTRLAPTQPDQQPEPALQHQLLITLYHQPAVLSSAGRQLLPQLAPGARWLQLGPQRPTAAQQLHAACTAAQVTLVHAPLTWSAPREMLCCPSQAREVLRRQARQTPFPDDPDDPDALYQRTLAALLALPAADPLTAWRTSARPSIPHARAAPGAASLRTDRPRGR